MIEEMIQNILEAEEKAKQIVKESITQSKDIVKTAKEHTVEIDHLVNKELKDKIGEATVNANYVAERVRKDMLDDCNKNNAHLKELAEKNKTQAIDFILGSLTK